MTKMANKKITSIALSAILLLSLSSCGITLQSIIIERILSTKFGINNGIDGTYATFGVGTVNTIIHTNPATWHHES